MASWDFIGWYEGQSLWLQLLLFPIIAPVMLIYNVVILTYLLLIWLPFAIIKCQIDSRRYWRKLHERGRVADWSEVEWRVNSGCATLVIEVTLKGTASCSWLIDRPRDEIDPDHAVPSWQQFAEKRLDLFEPNEVSEFVNRWTVDLLKAYESSVRVLILSRWQMARLSAEAKQQSVLAVMCWDDVGLSDFN